MNMEEVFNGDKKEPALIMRALSGYGVNDTFDL